MNTSDCFSL